MTFQIPKPLSAPLNIHYTYEDAEKAFARIVELYEQSGGNPADLDWKRIRRASGDTIATLISILERDVKESK